MSNLTDKVKLFAGYPEDGGSDPISFNINVTLRNSDNRLDFENFEDFLCDNLQGGKSTMFNYSEKIVIAQSDYNGRDLCISHNSTSGDVITISVPYNVKVHSISRVLAYSNQLAGLREKYCEIACPGISPYYETKHEKSYGIIGYKTYLNFRIEPLSSSLPLIMKESEIDAPNHFRLPVELQSRVTNLSVSEIYAERLIFNWFGNNNNIVVDFYHDMSAVDDSYKYPRDDKLHMGEEIYGEAAEQIGNFLAINPQFIPMQFIVIKSGGYLYILFVVQGYAWDISSWVKGCKHVL